jgi:hypothetical protein
MFGQHPQVGISNLPIAPNLLSTLATEMDVNRCLGLPVDIPLEQATLVASIHAEGSIDILPEHSANLRQADIEQQEQPEVSHSKKSMETHETTEQSVPTFHSEGFTCDKTEALVKKLVKCATVKTKSGSYFGWKGVGFQCGCVFNAVPMHVRFTVNNWLMMMDQELTRVTPPEELSDDMRKRPHEELLPAIQRPPEGLLHSFHDAFLPSILSKNSKYVGDVRHPWLSILLKIKAPTDATALEKATIRQCFSIVDKEASLTDPWRRVILRKVRKHIWELLDEFGESVLDTVMQHGDKGVIEQWGKWFQAPTIDDYNKAVLADEKRKATAEEREYQLMESPGRKHLRDKAFESLSQQGRMMKKRTQTQMQTQFDVGTIVQVPLHDVDTTKADGKTLTLIVVDIVQKKDNTCAMYRLACKAGVLDTLYHPSYMTSVAANSTLLGLDTVLDEWTGLPRIKERKAAASVSMVGGQGKHLGCGCKSGTCRTGRCACFKAGLKCNSKCHGGINKNCINKD